MKNKLLYAAFVVLNLLAIYVMIEHYSADYLYRNVNGAELEESTKSGSLFVIVTILCNLGVTAVLLFGDRMHRD